MKNPLVSVIIPAYNEEKYIQNALESIKKQSYDRLETVVVANGCSDNTAKVAREFGARVIETPVVGSSNAKNLGASVANGDIYAFLDADSVMKKGLIQAVVNSVDEGYTAGKSKIWSIEEGVKSRLICAYWDMVTRALMPIPGFDSGSGAFVFSTKEFFEKLVSLYGYGWNLEKLSLIDINFNVRAKKHGNYKYITESGVLTSMRRFKGRSFLGCFLEDAVDFFVKPKGKAIRKWIR